MYHNTQQTVHLLPLPFEVSDIVNSFLFYSIETVVKKKKKEIMQKINNAYQSRKNNVVNYLTEEDPDTEEHWSFMAYCPDQYEVQFQAISCKICGNYKISDTVEISKKTVCVCK